jgi:hypothetical protein
LVARLLFVYKTECSDLDECIAQLQEPAQEECRTILQMATLSISGILISFVQKIRMVTSRILLLLLQEEGFYLEPHLLHTERLYQY